MSAKVCKWCKHEYVEPCHGDKRCPNYEHAKKVAEDEQRRHREQDTATD